MRTLVWKTLSIIGNSNGALGTPAVSPLTSMRMSYHRSFSTVNSDDVPTSLGLSSANCSMFDAVSMTTTAGHFPNPKRA